MNRLNVSCKIHEFFFLLGVNIFEQKLFQLGENVTKTEKEGVGYDKSVFHMLNLISKLNAEYYTQKQCEMTLDNKNCLIQNNVLEKLKVRRLFY